MKKLLFVLLALLVSFTVLSCDNASEEEQVKVGLIVSAAGANDNGYNEFAIDGLEQAEEDFEIDIQVVNSADDVPGSLDTLARNGYDLIFSLEYNFNALITDDGTGESIAEKYPDTTFVIFNAFANTDPDTGDKIHDNVIEVLFNVNEGSFLAGALSVLVNENHDVLFTDEAYDFAPTTEARAVGFVGGTQSDGITVFSYGYAQGVNYVASDLDVTYDYYETYSAGFAPSTANYNTIDSYYQAGANIIFAAAGGVSTNMKNAAEDNGRLAIDVDANQDASVPGTVLTSVLKNTDVAVYDIVEQFINDELETGVEVFYDLDSGATGITDLSVIEGYISDSTEAQSTWADIKDEIDTITALIADGTIDVVDAQAGESMDIDALSNVDKVN